MDSSIFSVQYWEPYNLAMIQEIITYMIIGSALTLAILKIATSLGVKKRKAEINVKTTNTFSGNNNCSSCSAECMLRDAAAPVIQKNIDLCNKVEIKSGKL